MSRVLGVLHERRAALDAGLTSADLSSTVDAELARFIAISSSITPPGDPRIRGPRISPSTADELMRESEFLRRLGHRSPVLVDGPLGLSTQFWVATGRPAHVPRRKEVLDRSHFIEATHSSNDLANTKPFFLGLYTSTGVFGSFGMWWCYLEQNRGSTIHPFPWRVWSLEIDPSARIREIATATDWVAFVAAHSVRRDGLLYPDWRLAAADCDGVHMTLRAIATTQGLAFSAGDDVVAPPYWDVESTLWLRWSFASTEAVHEEDDCRRAREQ